MDIHRDFGVPVGHRHPSGPNNGNLWKGTRTMNRPALLILCGFFCLLTGVGTASAGQLTADTDYCKVSSLPLDPSNALGGIRLSRTSFLGITREYSTASIELVNLASA